MIPYSHIRLTEGPDRVDIRVEGRASHVGRLDDQSGIKNRAGKRRSRRALKKHNRTLERREEAQ